MEILTKEQIIEEVKECDFYKPRGEEVKKRLLEDLEEALKDVKDWRNEIEANCKCGCNRSDDFWVWDGYIIECCSCERGIQTFTKNLAIIKWNNKIY